MKALKVHQLLEMAINTDDKYYASPSLVNYVVNTALKVIGKENISEIIEPSAGDGAFIKKLDSLGIPTKYYDLYPEHPRIEKMDFAELNLPYKKGRLFLGGPPYATGSKLWLMFVRHAAEMGDYIAYISPPSFHDVNPYPEFLEVLHTEQLPYQQFYGSKVRGEKDVKMRSSFNIYKVNPNRKVEKDPLDDQLKKDFEVATYDKRFPKRKWEYYMNSWGVTLGEWNDTPQWSMMIGVNVKNEEMREIFEVWLDKFHDEYYEYFKSRSTGAPFVQLAMFKRLMKKDLY